MTAKLQLMAHYEYWYCSGDVRVEASHDVDEQGDELARHRNLKIVASPDQADRHG